MWSTKEFLIINTKHFGLKDEKTKKKNKKKKQKKKKKKKKKALVVGTRCLVLALL